MTQKPPWLLALQQDTSELEWFEDADREHEALHALWSGNGPPLMPLASTPLRLSQLLVERLVPVARGPAFHARIDVVEQRPLLLIERDDPQHLLVALHDNLPPFLWYPAGQDAASLERALSPYLHDKDPGTLSLSASARGFLGTQETLREDFDGLLRHFSMSPLTERLFWGSAYDEDPWPQEISQTDLPGLAGPASAFMEQRPGAAPSFRCRTIASRSTLEIAEHEGLFVATVHYEPAPHQELLGALNARFDATFPSDLPLDLAGCLLGVMFESADSIEALLEQADDPDDLSFYLYILSALCADDLLLAERLRPWMDHPDIGVRTTIADISLRQGMMFLALELLESEADDALRHRIEDALS